jgi:hypothetical protein
MPENIGPMGGLAIVVFSDLVESTALLARLGEMIGWRKFAAHTSRT